MSKPLFQGIISPAASDTNIPSKFICPLTNKIMENPVRIVGSKFPVAYEDQALEIYFEEHGYIDPKTKEDFGDHIEKTPDLSLKRQIEDFLNEARERSLQAKCRI